MKNKPITKKPKNDEVNSTEIEVKGSDFAKIWFLRIFHTVCMFVCAYVIVLFTATSIPTVIPFVLGGIGFSVTATMSSAEYIVALCAGLFLTAWMIITDYLLIRGAWHLYKRNIGKTVKKDKNNKIMY